MADMKKEVGMPPVRQRSLYTAHTYHQDASLPAYHDYSKFLGCGSGQAELMGVEAWQPSWRAPMQKNHTYYPDDVYLADSWRDLEGTDNDRSGYIPTVTPHGTIRLRLRNEVILDMTVDSAVRVANMKYNIVLALSRTGGAAALIHPNGRVYHYGSRVEIQARPQTGNNRYAKMWYKGVSFTAEECSLVYLVDSAGTRTTTDTFVNMNMDFSQNVFYNDSNHGMAQVNRALSLVQHTDYWLSDDHTDNWIINNVRISQTGDGLVRIHRCSHKFQMRTSPSNGSASITSPFIHCTASMGQTKHLFVRRGERRMHFDGSSFIVRNAGHSAGFDDKNQLKPLEHRMEMGLPELENLAYTRHAGHTHGLAGI